MVEPEANPVTNDKVRAERARGGLVIALPKELSSRRAAGFSCRLVLVLDPSVAVDARAYWRAGVPYRRR